MQLSAQTIRQYCLPQASRRVYLASGVTWRNLPEPLIAPYYEQFLQSGSYDLHLGTELLYPNAMQTSIDLRKPRPEKDCQYRTVTISTECDAILQPGERALGRTIEWVTLPNFLQSTLDGKSSLGRDGLEVHKTAGVFDAGFAGHPVVELHNHSLDPWVLYYGMPIAQMSFDALDKPTDKPYSAKHNHYQDQVETVGNRTVDTDNPFLI